MIQTDKPGQAEPNDIVQAAASDQANRCRRLAQSINDRATAELLEQMAADYDRRAMGQV